MLEPERGPGVLYQVPHRSPSLAHTLADIGDPLPDGQSDPQSGVGSTVNPGTEPRSPDF